VRRVARENQEGRFTQLAHPSDKVTPPPPPAGKLSRIFNVVSKHASMSAPTSRRRGSFVAESFGDGFSIDEHEKHHGTHTCWLIFASFRPQCRLVLRRIIRDVRPGRGSSAIRKPPGSTPDRLTASARWRIELTRNYREAYGCLQPAAFLQS